MAHSTAPFIIHSSQGVKSLTFDPTFVMKWTKGLQLWSVKSPLTPQGILPAGGPRYRFMLCARHGFPGSTPVCNPCTL